MVKSKSKVAKGRGIKTDREEPVLLPVTILSGFLGAGKTTLLKHILESNQHKMKIAVIVNDMAELNIDSSLVEKSGLVQSKQEVVSMQNGCICCTLRTDLIREVNRLQSMGGFDYLVIESTGISEPMQVAESFVADPNTEQVAQNAEDMLWNSARLDTLVTVVDIREFPAMMNSLHAFKDKFAVEDGEDEEGDKNISQLLLEQVEFANVILLNKCDLVDEKQKEEAQTLIKTLNPEAKVILSSYSTVDLDEILNTKLFDMEAAQAAPGWLKSLNTKGDNSTDFAAAAIEAAGESEEYGVSSFVFRSRRPFHPERLHSFISSIMNFPAIGSKQQKAAGRKSQMRDSSDVDKLAYMQKEYGWVLRSKGFCWIAGRDDEMAEWAQAGRFVNITPLMNWYADMPEEQWPVETEAEKEAVRQTFAPVYGDRRQEIVFIGTDLKKDRLTEALTACVLSEEEFDLHDLDATGVYFDPLPTWCRNFGVPQEMFHCILREGQAQRLSVEDGCEIDMASIALEHVWSDEAIISDDTACAVKVWLDLAPRQPSLLCTLRPEKCEQVPIGLTLGRTQGDNYYTLRVEVVHRHKRKRGTDRTAESYFKVHIIGTCLAVQTFEEEEMEGEEGEACPLPHKH